MSDCPWLSHYDPGVPAHLDLPALPAFSMLDETVKRHGTRPAFNFLGKRYTWAQIGSLADRLACGLQRMGVGKGVHVGLFLPNCPYYLIAYYAILKTGATVVNFNPLYAERELAHQIEDSETDVLITVDLDLLFTKAQKMFQTTRLKTLVLARFADALPFPKNLLFPIIKFKEIARIPRNGNIVWFRSLIDNDGIYSTPVIDPAQDIAVLQYTGGTTGTPKGAMLTHRNIHMNALQSVAWFADVKPGQERMLAVLPFFHVFAMTAIMNFSVVTGLEIFALPRFDLEQALEIIHRHKIQIFQGVPALYNAMNQYPYLKRFDLTSLRYCISGGAPLPVEVKKTFEQITGCVVVEGYGLTESSPVACINPARGENRAGSIGLPVSNTTVEIIDPATAEIVPAGNRGELCIRGPQVMKGYWKKPEETAAILRDGRLHTGDIAVMDERGYVYIVDRMKDMIITNGYNVYPRNVEEAIYQHPAVAECVVAGLPDTQRGEIVKAWVKLKENADLDAEKLRAFLEDKLSKMEMPKIFEFRTEPLPKTMIGKLSRKDLLEQEKNKA
ncbi:MAG: long-chain fatty acid--CoA ligase [Alphaproteobacteria bacterium]|nr:long-chain fatty acid--CoA ligase [Alphaproteobacteria bacterium]